MGIRTRLMGFLGFGNPKPMRRAYNGAIVSRLTSDWMTSQSSADAEIKGNLRRLRDRSAPSRGNDHASGANYL